MDCINKEYSDVSNTITGTSTSCLSNYTYTASSYYTGMTLLDKYYKIVKKARSVELPVAAQRDILKLIGEEKSRRLEFNIDYLTIECEDGVAQYVCHVVVKEILFSYWTYPSYSTTYSNPPPCINHETPYTPWEIMCSSSNNVKQ